MLCPANVLGVAATIISGLAAAFVADAFSAPSASRSNFDREGARLALAFALAVCLWDSAFGRVAVASVFALCLRCYVVIPNGPVLDGGMRDLLLLFGSAFALASARASGCAYICPSSAVGP